VVLRLFNARIINAEFFAQALRRCFVQFSFGLLAGVTLLFCLDGEIRLGFRTSA
jgi:hypothetical protein